MPRKSNSHPLVWGFNRYTIFSVYINRIKHKELHTNNEKLSTVCTNWSSKGSVEEKKKHHHDFKLSHLQWKQEKTGFKRKSHFPCTISYSWHRQPYRRIYYLRKHKACWQKWSKYIWIMKRVLKLKELWKWASSKLRSL